jgi:DNA-binding Xre family transcriptional regulator
MQKAEGVVIVISYEPLRILLVRRKMKKMDFIKQCKIAPGTAAKLWKDEYVALKIIDDICNTLGCEIEDVMKHIKDEIPDQEE